MLLMVGTSSLQDEYWIMNSRIHNAIHVFMYVIGYTCVDKGQIDVPTHPFCTVQLHVYYWLELKLHAIVLLP